MPILVLACCAAGAMAALDAADRTLANGGWSAAGAGASATTYHLATYNGTVMAGGPFNLTGSPSYVVIASWNGSSWSSLGSGITGGNAGPMIQYGSSFYIGGDFTQSGGVSSASMARWDGSAWHDASSTSFTNPTDGITVHGGDLYTTCGGTVYHLVGTTWQSIGSADGRIRVFSDPIGLIAAGHITSIGGVSVSGYGYWDGAAWHDLGNGLAQASGWLEGQRALRYGGNLIAVGQFDVIEASVITGHHVAWWDGSAWHALGGGLTGNKALCASVFGNALVVGGEFTAAGATGAANLAWWDGSTWNAFGTGTNVTVCDSLTVGDRLWVSGGFSTIDGTTASMIAFFTPTPAITSHLTAAGHRGRPFSYQITANSTPDSFAASGLPAGLAIDTATGVISGTPQATGVTMVTISATNAGGSDSETLAITVTEPASDSEVDGILNTGIGPNCGAGTGMSIILIGWASLGLIRRRRD